MKQLLIYTFWAVSALCAQAADSATENYNKALTLRDQGQFPAAIEEAAKAVAQNPMDRDLMAKSEMLCAELYVKLKRFDAAEVTARQIELLYKGTEFEAKANALREQIKQLKEQSGNPESE